MGKLKSNIRNVFSRILQEPNIKIQNKRVLKNKT